MWQREEVQEVPWPQATLDGIAMVLRSSTKGRHAGRPFYGCPNFPRCREIKPLGHTETSKV